MHENEEQRKFFTNDIFKERTRRETIYLYK